MTISKHTHARCEETIARLEAENASLRQRLDEMERRLALNSQNSGKPPSSDGLKKPPSEARTRSLRRKSGRNAGGQTGHPGRTLHQRSDPDATWVHAPSTCNACGSPLSDGVGRPVVRQVFDLPTPQPLQVTEHRAYAGRCRRCGTTTPATFPQGVTAPVQYGPRLRATAVYLHQAHFLPEARLSQVLADLFQAKVAPATLAAMSRRSAKRLWGFVERLREVSVSRAGVKHLDETGLRMGGRTAWLHVVCTPWLAWYRVEPQRGHLPSGLSGCVIHDHWQPYFTLAGVVHGLCNAHHLRELQALMDIEKEAWAAQMQHLLYRAWRLARRARQRGVVVAASLASRIEQRYDAILTEALSFHEGRVPLPSARPGQRGRKKRRIGHNLALRLRDRKLSVLRFQRDPTVPFTNNEAERDLRMMKLRQKVSGGFRSERGASDFAVLRSVLTTARKQGWDLLATLMTPCDDLAAALRYA